MSVPAPRGRLLVAALAVALVAVACAGGGGAEKAGDEGDGGPTTTAPTTTTTPPLVVAVSPAAGAKDVPLNAGVTVTATSGTLTHVALVPLAAPAEADDASTGGTSDGGDGTTTAAPPAGSVAGNELPGTLAPDGRSWKTTWPMSAGTTYRVTVTGSGAAPAPTTFTTLTPVDELHTRLNVFQGSTYGVGMPVVVYLNHKVAKDKRPEIEAHLHLKTEPALTGAWYWFADDELHWRPALYWPPGTKAHLKVDFKGLDAGGGVWGVDGRSVDFAIGDAHMSLVDADTHTMTVKSNGQVVRTIPVSTGRDKYPTKSGIHVVNESEAVHVMDSSTVGIPRDGPDGYYETVKWDVRISNSGEFVHAAPWSTGSQGNANVSHGCVNLSDAEAEWFFHFTQIGDVVEVVNTPEQLQPWNGYGDWQIPWDQWSA